MLLIKRKAFLRKFNFMLTYNNNDILIIFRKIIQEFTALSDITILDYIDISYNFVKIDDFKNQIDYNFALMYFTANLIKNSITSSASGQIIKKEIGDLAITYSTTTKSANVSGSFYFDEYLKLLKSNGSVMLYISD